MPSPITDHVVPWPPDAAQRYAAGGYWAGITLGDLLREAAARRPGDAPALIDPVASVRLSHAELAERADAAAVRLLDLGIEKGDRIVVQLANGWSSSCSRSPACARASCR